MNNASGTLISVEEGQDPNPSCGGDSCRAPLLDMLEKGVTE